MNKRRRHHPPGSHWSNDQWFAVPQGYLDSEHLRTLSKPAKLALLKLMSHADFSTGITYPGVRSIAEAVYGTTTNAKRARERESHVRAALRELETGGWIEVVEVGGGRGRATVYRMKNPGETRQGCNSETRAKSATVSATKPGPIHSPNPGENSSQTRADFAPPINKRTHEPTKQTNAAVVHGVLEQDRRDQLRVSLEAEGLGTADYLIDELPVDATEADIHTAMRGISPNAETGAHVKHLRQNIAEAIETRRQREQRQRKAAEQRKTWLDQAQQRLDELDAEHVNDDEPEAMAKRANLVEVASGANLTDADRELIRRLSREPVDSPLRQQAEQSRAIRAMAAQVQREREQVRERRRLAEQAAKQREDQKRQAEQAFQNWWQGLSHDALADVINRIMAESPPQNPEALRRAFNHEPRGVVVQAEVRRWYDAPDDDEPDQAVASTQMAASLPDRTFSK